MGGFVRASGGAGGQMLTASVARSLWSGPLPVMRHERASEVVHLWWGPVLQVDPGDEVTLLPTPIGSVVDGVRKAGVGWL